MGYLSSFSLLLALVLYSRAQVLTGPGGNTIIRFKESTASADEADGLLEVCLVRVGSLEQINRTEDVFLQPEELPADMEEMVGSAPVDDEVDRAEAGVDFNEMPIRVEFLPGETEACADLPIIQDQNDNEDDEAFQIALFRPTGLGGALQRINESEPLEALIKGMKGTAVGDPMFTVPLSLPTHARTTLKSNSVGLCFEVHGIEKGVYNLFSDYCISVNGLFTVATDPSVGNIISEVGMVAVDDEGFCHHISISLYDRSVEVDGRKLSYHDRFHEAGIAVRRTAENTVRIAVPNCKDERIVFRVHFGLTDGVEMLSLTVGKAKGLSTESHGLMGQFWNTPADILPHPTEPDSFRVKVHSLTSGVRQFEADLHPLTWDYQYRPCLYGGDRQGYPVIEGKHHDYHISGGLFSTDFTYSQFSSLHCEK